MQALCGALCYLWASSAPLILSEGVRSFTTFRYGKLTGLWAQEACAIPEARAFIAELEQRGFPLRTTTVGVYDIGFKLASVRDHARLTAELHDHLARTDDRDGRAVLADFVADAELRAFLRQAYADRPARDQDWRHGTAVVHLIASNSEVSTSSKGEIALLIASPRKLALEEYIELHSSLARLELPPLVNHSMAFSKFDDRWSEAIAEAFEAITAKTIVVNSIGNYHNLNNKLPIEAGVRKLVGKMINVGSADPTGHISLFSKRDEGTIETVRAFSDDFIATLGLDGSLIAFGGTSGATPVVTGALADTLAILPDLSVSQAEVLLKKTAVPSSYGDRVGTLNSYKLVRVAQRLRERGWPAYDDLNDDSLYDFSAAAQRLAVEATATPEGDEKFAKLRQSFFLAPDNRQVRRQLGQLYRQAGYEAQALFYGDSTLASRDEFMARLFAAQQQHLAEFLQALEAVDVGSAQWALAKLDRELIKARTIIAILQKLSPAQRLLIIDFFRANGIARITIDANGTSYKRIFNRP